jgi:hypothetical protein
LLAAAGGATFLPRLRLPLLVAVGLRIVLLRILLLRTAGSPSVLLAPLVRTLFTG